MIRTLLKTRPSQRSSADKALHHKWLKWATRAPSTGDLAGKREEKHQAPAPGPLPSTPEGGLAGQEPEGGLLLDLELDDLPTVDRDIYSPIRCNPSLHPTLIRAASSPVCRPAKLAQSGHLDFEPWGAPNVHL